MTRDGSTRPNEFRPERWDGDLAKTLHRYAYFPFGGGPRFCIGQAFAQMEAVLLLATLARAYRVDVLPRPRPTPEPSVTLRPKHGLRVRLTAGERAELAEARAGQAGPANEFDGSGP